MDNFVCKTVGLEEQSGVRGVYPNPFQSDINLSLISNIKNLKVRLFDLSGKQVEIQEFLKPLNQVVFHIPSSLPEGTYFLQVVSENGSWYKKLVHKN
ncbi:MAG: T9SS type A sorting domain-containing protein [Bacteroidia bacterium]|nr:T9SS type A sorting domain-containing protein [Bacteroidia bacterium]